MKKILKITGIVLIVITLIVLIIAAFNWEKVVVLKKVITGKHTEKDLQELEKRNYEVLNKAAGTLDITLVPLTEEEKTALKEGKITEEEAKQIILGKKVYVNQKVVDAEIVKPTTPETETSDTTVEIKPSEEDGTVTTVEPTDKSAEIISEIYVLESTYKSKLREIERGVIIKYNALPKSEKTNLNKYKLGNEGISQGLALKSECDGKMAVLLSRLETVLKESGKDTGLVDEIKAVYEDEKTTVQAYYVGKYTK